MNYFIKLPVLALFLTGICSARLAFANPSVESPTLYFVDMQRAIDKSIVGKAAKSDMEAEITKRQAALALQKNEVEKLKSDLDKQSSLLAPDALAQKRSAVEKKERELARQIQDQRGELGKKNGESINKIVKEIDLIVKDLAKKENYGFILEKDPSYVLYLSDKFDITDQIIKLLDKKKTEL